MGKWSGLKGSYPKAPLDGTYQEKIEAVLNSPAPLAVLGLSETAKAFTVRELSDYQLVRLFNQAKAAKEDLEEKIKILTLELTAYTQLLVERYDDQGIEKATYEDGATVGIHVEPYPVVTDSGKLLAWVRANDLEAMLSLNYQTLTSLVKDAIENGKLLPDGVDVYLKDKLSRRGGKEKA
jgi:hypothetical protein